MRFRPFAGLRPANSAVARSYSCPPYDVLSEEEARALAEAAEASFVRVVRPEVNFEAGAPREAGAVYEQARENLEGAVAQGLLVREQGECLYVYGLGRPGARWQWGIVGLVAVDEYGPVVRVHETTREAKERDRTLLTRTVGAHTGPVFLCYRDKEEIDEVVRGVVESSECLLEFEADDGVTHRVWKCTEEAGELVRLFANVDTAYVADGHHRAASAVAVAKEFQDEQQGQTGVKDQGGFLAVLFPASQLCILPYNRVVKDLNGLSPEEFLSSMKKKVSSLTRLSSKPQQPPTKAGSFYTYIDGQCYMAEFDAPLDSLPVTERLDAHLLQATVLQPLLGIHDIRRTDRVEFVGGVHGLAQLEKLVDTGEAAVAFALHPVDISDLMDVADHGQYMPPKSTWFEPKLRSGLFVNTFRRDLSSS